MAVLNPPEGPVPSQPAPVDAARRPWLTWAIIVIVLGVGGAYALKGTGLKSWIRDHTIGKPARPPKPIPSVGIAETTPVDCDGNVPVDVTLRLQIDGRTGPVDPATFRPNMVTIIRTRDRVKLDADSRLSEDGSSFILKPKQPLERDTCYSVYVTAGMKTLGNDKQKPADVKNFSMAFTTEGSLDKSIRFEQVKLPSAQKVGFTCVTIAPDGRLWAGSDDGRIFRFEIAPDGTLLSPQVITSLQEANGGPRLISGFCFDPKAPKEQPVIYVNHGVAAFENVPDFSGKMTRMSGPNLEVVEDLLVGVPRSFRDHLNLQPSFGPDGAIYYSQGSNSAFGAPDNFWGQRPERPLTAVITRVDLSKITPGKPVDITTPDGGGKYDPYAPDAPVTIYAYGVRLAYDLLWHSNGHLYVPVNGSSSGGNSPELRDKDGKVIVPGINNIPLSEHDWLLRITPGKYYGHPNPTHGYYILNGANPTDGGDWAEVAQYPVGTMPDPRYDPPVHDFGKHVSANGILEYKSDAFGGKLKGMLVVCRYNVDSDLIFIGLDEKGDIDRFMVKIEGTGNFSSPLDVCENPKTGALYVAEYGARCITLLRPIDPNRGISRSD